MKQIKPIVVNVLGGTVLGAGVALIVLPGAAFIVIPLGLAILAVEFAWAKRWLRSARAVLPLNPRSGAAVAKKRITPAVPAAELLFPPAAGSPNGGAQENADMIFVFLPLTQPVPLPIRRPVESPYLRNRCAPFS